jgi:hypothetical protein
MKFLGPPQSGSSAGQTASRNTFGQYWRTRSIPVNPNSTQQGVARARLALYAAGYRALTDAQRAGWRTLGLSMTRSDSLGQSYTLSGLQAYVSVNTLNAAASNSAVADAPALITPAALLTATVTLTAAAFSIAYTTTPLAAGTKLFTFVSPQRSAGRAYESDFRLLAVSAAAAASPADVYAAYVNKFGVPIVGNRIFLRLEVYSGGFLSGPLNTSKVVA